MSTETKLMNKNFLLFVAGWELSMIGDALLRFALPLYIFLTTNNATLMGTLLTWTSLPLIFFTPIGGVMADRFNKRFLMVIMNLVIGMTTALYLIFLDQIDMVWFTPLMMLILFTLASLLTPSAEATIPALVPSEQLVKANGITFLLTIFSSVGAPMVAGFMLERGDLSHLLWLSASLFSLASLVKSWVKIPYQKTKMETGILKLVINDLKLAYHFVTKEKPQLGKVILVISLASFIIAPIMSVALSVLVTGYFGGSETVAGLAQGLVVFGGTFGVVFIGILGKKATVEIMRPLLFVLTGLLLLTGIIFRTSLSQEIIFILTIGTFFVSLSFMTVLAIISWAYLQENTSETLIGKVMALNGSLVALGVALGNSLYGFLFDFFGANPAYVFFILTGISLVISLVSKIKLENDI